MSRNLRLRIFIVATLAIFATGVFLIGDKQLLFSSTYPVRTDFADVAGLAVGADVRIGGVREGTVRRIELPKQPEGKMTVYLDLNKHTRDLIEETPPRRSRPMDSSAISTWKWPSDRRTPPPSRTTIRFPHKSRWTYRT